MDRPPTLDELRNEVRYQRERLTLYRRRGLIGKDTSDSRLRERERELASAEERLHRALHPPPPP